VELAALTRPEPQDGPRDPQDGPREPQDDPRWPKTTQDDPKTLPEHGFVQKSARIFILILSLS